MQPMYGHRNSLNESHPPGRGLQNLSKLPSSELSLVIPDTSLSTVQPPLDESRDTASLSPRGAPSPPLSPVPTPSIHGDTPIPDFANVLPRPTPESLYILSANSTTASLSDAVSAYMLSSTASLSSPSSESEARIHGAGRRSQLLHTGVAQQHVTLPTLSLPYAPPHMPLSAEAATGAQFSQHGQPSSGNDGEDTYDPSYSHSTDETGFSAHEVQRRRRLIRKAELARISRLSKKRRMNELEAENAVLYQQLAVTKQQQEVATVGVGLVDLQSALQSIADAVVPTLQVLSSSTNIPATVCGMPLTHANDMDTQQVNAAHTPAQASATGTQAQPQPERGLRRRRVSWF